jgi:chorismate--pyruvate lyase
LEFFAGKGLQPSLTSMDVSVTIRSPEPTCIFFMTTANAPTRWRAEPRWQPVRRLNRAGIPPKYLPWLLDRSSLTERLIARCRDGFHVRLLSQTRARPLRTEAAVLGMRPGTRAVVRQVQLICGETPWVYARTVIPPRTLARQSHRFARLGGRSLGAMLFADPSLERGDIEVACLTPAETLYRSAMRTLLDPPPAIWGRRSLFRLGGKPLLVCEFFLPQIAEF